MQGNANTNQRSISGHLGYHWFLIVFALLPSSVLTQRASIDPAEILRTGNIEAKREALFQLRNQRSANSSRIAAISLSDPNELVRATAAAAIVFLPPDEAAAALLPLLNDKFEFVRREAAYALGKAGSFSATDALLVRMQKDRTFEVRTAAAIALGDIGDPKAIETLATILKKRPKEDEEFLRRSAARSIGQIAQFARTGKTRALTPQNFLPDSYKNLEGSGTLPLAGRFPAIQNAVAELARVLQNNSEAADTRREAAFALGAIGDESAIPVLTLFSSSDDPYLAQISKEALLTLRSPER